MIEIPIEFDADGFPMMAALNLNTQPVRSEIVMGDYRKICRAMENKEVFGVKHSVMVYAPGSVVAKINWLTRQQIIDATNNMGVIYYNPFLVVNCQNYTAFKDRWLIDNQKSRNSAGSTGSKE